MVPTDPVSREYGQHLRKRIAYLAAQPLGAEQGAFVGLTDTDRAHDL
jgi:hypothetical protein